jgi:hypothetical protein
LLEDDGAVFIADNLVPGTDRPLYHIWPGWDTFMRFYRDVREEWLGTRRAPRDGCAVERLYAVWAAGGDVDAMREVLRAERSGAADPRQLLIP